MGSRRNARGVLAVLTYDLALPQARGSFGLGLRAKSSALRITLARCPTNHDQPRSSKLKRTISRISPAALACSTDGSMPCSYWVLGWRRGNTAPHHNKRQPVETLGLPQSGDTSNHQSDDVARRAQAGPPRWSGPLLAAPGRSPGEEWKPGRGLPGHYKRNRRASDLTPTRQQGPPSARE